MARYSASWQSVTITGTADTVTITNNTYCGVLRGGNSAMQAKINEVYIGGESSASNPTPLTLARTSTVSTGALSGGNNALLDATGTAPGTTMGWGNVAASAGPQRSATLYLLNLSLNTFGGIARWQARYGEEITTYGTTANVGEVILSAKSGSGITSGHILYELV